MRDCLPAVPPFRTVFPPSVIDRVVDDTRTILRSGRLVLGDYTELFEGAVADMAGTRYAVAVNSGTTALEIIMRHLRVTGRGVLVPTNTNFATAAAVVHAGGVPVLFDSGIDVAVGDMATAANESTVDIAAAVIVHVGGYISDSLRRVRSWCDEMDIVLVEDAAHAHGTTIAGAPAGSLGYAAAFSFFPTKVVTTFEGGAITTDDEQLDQTARLLRDQGKDPITGEHIALGNSWRLTEIGAAVGLAQLRDLDSGIAARAQHGDLYRSALENNVDFVVTSSVQNGYKLLARARSAYDRIRLGEDLARFGVSLAGGVYERPLHRHSVFAELSGGRQFPIADLWSNCHYALPLWADMEDVEREAVVAAVLTHYEEPNEWL